MDGTKTKALYGFSPDIGPFADRSPSEQAALLDAWGCTAVFGGYTDPYFVDAVHAQGMKIYAEFGCFVGSDWWDEVPLSRPVNAAGKHILPEGGYYGGYCGVNPANPEVRRRQLDALEGLVKGHIIDGVWLDFIRWPCHWEVPEPNLFQTSFDPLTLGAFSRDTGVGLPAGQPADLARVVLEEYRDQWVDWRCLQITSWVAQAADRLRQVRPHLTLGLFGVPWRLEDFDGAILDIIGQDYRALAEHVDVFSPMVYHRMCARPLDWIASVTEEIHALSGRSVWPIVQSVDEPEQLSASEYAQALTVALESPASEGVLVFTLAGTVEDRAKLVMTEDCFQRFS